MGNKQSRSNTPEFISACKRFSQTELRDLKALFISLASQSRSHGEFISASVFQAYYGIHGSLGSRLFDLVSSLRKDQSIFYEDLVISKAAYEKGSPAEVEGFVYQLMDLLGDGFVQRSEVEAVVVSVLETVLGPDETISGAGLPNSSIQGFLKAAEFSLFANGEMCMSLEDFHKWCLTVPSLKRCLCSLMVEPTADNMGRRIPQLKASGIMNSVLRKEFAWHIAGVLQQEAALEWTLLYHSSVHGFSFNTFLDKVSSAGGPSVFLVKDQEGSIFGGYASQSWERHGDFYGEMKSFLFTLQPRAAIYRASGLNGNLQWCAINFTSDSIPNGIGFGGQKNHFGIYIPASFDHGYTFPSITYNNPILTSKTDFVPDVIECWGVLAKTEDKSKALSTPNGTVLQRFKEDRHMLNMVGIANASDSVG